MPTVNPRVNVTLSPSLFALVGAMARAQRVSNSQVLRELLEAAEPALQRVVKMIEAADRAKGAVNKGFGASLLRSQQLIQNEMDTQLAMVDGVASDLVSLAEGIEGRRPGRARPGAHGTGGAAQNPPASNRGVKSVKTTQDAPTPRPSFRGSARPPKGRKS